MLAAVKSKNMLLFTIVLESISQSKLNYVVEKKYTQHVG
jgi:hypothetical protein